jgi:hypothetical protein
MSIRTKLDTQPGALPIIRADGDTVVFHLGVVGVQKGACVLVRCDEDGNVWASLTAAETLGGDLRINRLGLQRRSSQ